MARIDFDTVYAASTSPVSGSLDLGTGANRAVLAFVTCPDGQTVSAATVTSGAALTQLATGTASAGNYHRWYLFGVVLPDTAPNQGAKTITFTGSGSGLKYGLVASYDSTTSIRSGVVGSEVSTGATAGPTFTATTVSSDLCVLLGHCLERGTSITAGTGSTAFSTVDEFGLQETASGTSTVVDGTLAVGGSWAAGVAVLVQVAGAPVLSSPTAAATGNTTASGTVTTTGTDGTLYAVRSAAQPTNTQIVAGHDSTGTTTASGSLAITTSGSKTVPLTSGPVIPSGSQTIWFLHRPAAGSSLDSNVPSATYTQPATLAWSGTYPNQTGVAGAAFVHSGSIPTPTGGVGTKTYSATGLGASGLTVNTATGQLQGTCGTAGTYTITPTVTDSSTAGTPTPQTGSLAAFTLTIGSGSAGPTINTQPSNQTAKVGASATFTLAATSSGGALSYQWRLGGTPISGATSASYTRTGVALGDHGGSYTCSVTDSNGTTISSAATLTVAVTFSGTVPTFTGATGASGSIDLSSYFSGGLSRTFAVLSGSMPTGLTQVGTTAVWTGTLGSVGSGSFVVRATDSATNTDVTNTVNWSIGVTAPGTITSEPLANNNDVPLPNKALTWIGFRNLANGASVLVKTGQSTNSSSQFSVSDAALTPGQFYLVDWVTVDGERGHAVAQAV